MLSHKATRRLLLGAGAATLGAAWWARAAPRAASDQGAGHQGAGNVVDVGSGKQLGAILNAGPAASGGKTYRLAANTDFGPMGVYNLDYTSNPITITGQAGTVAP